MADTTLTLNSGSGGEDVAGDDDVTLGFHQYVKLKFGGSGTFTTVTASAGLPVTPDSGGFDVTNAGTFAVQAAQSGTWTVDLGATDNAVLDAIAASVAGTLTVGSHAVTNAGTFAVQVDGDALTALQLIDNAIYVDDADWTDSTSSHVLVGGLYQSTPQTVTDGDVAPFQIDSNGRLLVSAAAGSAEKLDDQAFTLTSDAVVMMGAIRDDSLSTLTAAEGDAVPFRVSSTGALHVTGAGGGTQYTVDDAGPTVVTMAGVVRDDSLTTLTEVDGDATVLRVNSTGALHVTGGGGGTEYTEDVATANPIVGTATLMERDDALSTVTPIEGDWIAFRGTAEGALWVQDFNSDAILSALQGTLTVDNGGTFAVQAAQSGTWNVTNISGTVSLPTGAATSANQSTANTALSNIQTAVELIDNAISGSEMQVDVVAALPTGTNSIGTVGHNTTNLADGVTTVTTAGTDVVLASSTVAKWVIIQAQTDNTGIIAVGNAGVDATVATGTGIALAAGESVTIPCSNLNTIYIDSTVDTDGVRYTYGT